jgi:hypothetical protein
MCVLIFSTTFVWNISHSKTKWARYDETWFFSTDFRKKPSNFKFNQNTSSGSRVVPWGQMDGHTDMTKLRVAFRSFVNAPKNCISTDVAVLYKPFPWWRGKQHCQAPLLNVLHFLCNWIIFTKNQYQFDLCLTVHLQCRQCNKIKTN